MFIFKDDGRRRWSPVVIKTLALWGGVHKTQMKEDLSLDWPPWWWIIGSCDQLRNLTFSQMKQNETQQPAIPTKKANKESQKELYASYCPPKRLDNPLFSLPLSWSVITDQFRKSPLCTDQSLNPIAHSERLDTQVISSIKSDDSLIQKNKMDAGERS